MTSGLWDAGDSHPSLSLASARQPLASQPLGAPHVAGLAENRCLERYPDGCKLLQVRCEAAVSAQ